MKTIIAAIVLICSVTSFAQQRGGGDPNKARVGGGHIPARGPASVRTPPTVAAARPTRGQSIALAQGGVPQGVQPRRTFTDQPGHPAAPHVHATNDQWIGHDTGRADPHYRVDNPWARGHFTGELGASHVYRLEGGNRDRVRLGGVFFSVAPYDFDDTSDWAWDSDDITLYADPDHDGWYLAYNVRLGTFVHVTYLGLS